MKNNTIHILAIIPYEGIEASIKKIASKKNGLKLTTFVGNLEDGVEIFQQNKSKNYDVIISRGGTAELLKEVTQIPVIEISLSVYDILRAIKLAENYNNKYAIVGFPSITHSAHILCDLLRYDIDIYTINSEVEVNKVLHILKAEGYSMVLCDMITHTVAIKMGLNAILITSGTESIEETFDRALKLCTSYANIRQENHILYKVLKSQPGYTIILYQDHSVFFSTCSPHIEELLLPNLTTLISDALLKKSKKTFQLIESSLYSINSTLLELEEQTLIGFNIEPKATPLSHKKHGLVYTNRLEIESRLINSFYTFTAQSTVKTFEQISESLYPIMIIGEEGAQKDHTAFMIYTKSSKSKNPFIIVDCTLTNDKTWNFLLNNHNSPFYDNDNTIYISHMNAISDKERSQLLASAINLNLCKRNSVIFSFTAEKGELNPSAIIPFINHLSCITLNIPPLREQKEDITSISTLFFNTINMDLSKQIIGFEPEALSLLREYHWPYNYVQLKRILTELALLTDTTYIKAESVEKILANEMEVTPVNSTSETKTVHTNNLPLDITKTLSEINKDIVKLVLDGCNGNKSYAAKKLGISRTTLWRYIK